MPQVNGRAHPQVPGSPVGTTPSFGCLATRQDQSTPGPLFAPSSCPDSPYTLSTFPLSPQPPTEYCPRYICERRSVRCNTERGDLQVHRLRGTAPIVIIQYHEETGLGGTSDT
ncbi:hypothetical protein BGX38DRAFT_1213740 [Terfezia claveryi]|nr:hypothetical protein BGX38DRAFT_1213740 [Terfezia claveryi]